jgi:DNA-binding LytR/AlgR family response regulator
MIRCIAIDDSPLALDLLADYARRSGVLSLEYRCTQARDAIQKLKENRFDLVFLDIQMPDVNGLELARAIDKHTKIIFTTAYPDHAVEGFNLDAVDYLLKPFSFARFMQAVDKAVTRMRSEQAVAQPLRKEDEPCIYLRSGYDTVKVLIGDIEYIEALKDYIQVFTSRGKVLSLMSMKEILALLPQDEFIRVHRSFIVPVSRINRISSKKIRVKDKEIPVGDVFRAAFQERIAKKIP